MQLFETTGLATVCTNVFHTNVQFAYIIIRNWVNNLPQKSAITMNHALSLAKNFAALHFTMAKHTHTHKQSETEIKCDVSFISPLRSQPCHSFVFEQTQVEMVCFAAIYRLNYLYLLIQLHRKPGWWMRLVACFCSRLHQAQHFFVGPNFPVNIHTQMNLARKSIHFHFLFASNFFYEFCPFFRDPIKIPLNLFPDLRNEILLFI